MTFCDSNGHTWDNHANLCTVCSLDYHTWCLQEFNNYRNGKATESVVKCECGAESIYGKDTNLHSKIMPCPKYKEST
jgi:hypothetical protein